MIDRHQRPRIAITVGDVAGVGPELALRCAGLPQVIGVCEPILYGPMSVIAQIAKVVRAPDGVPRQVRPASDDGPVEQRGNQRGDESTAMEVQVRDVGQLELSQIQPGIFTAATGRASFEAVDAAIADAVSGNVDAIVTGPIQKEAWHLAGFRFPGHTEMLADRLSASDYCMMLTSPQISCVLVTVHLPLADVAGALTTNGVLRAIRLAATAMSNRNSGSPRIIVCGLNPHAGENGLLSHGEEITIIQPAVDQARKDGIDVRGPLSPDTAFSPANRAITDAYVCMYHDQGLIPLKALAFDDAVNVTLGLPIIRTSVDHGTALDLAWQGKANHQSMLAAIEMAVELYHG